MNLKKLVSRYTVFFNGWRARGRAEEAGEPSTCSRGTLPTPPFGPEGLRVLAGPVLQHGLLKMLQKREE